MEVAGCPAAGLHAQDLGPTRGHTPRPILAESWSLAREPFHNGVTTHGGGGPGCGPLCR